MTRRRAVRAAVGLLAVTASLTVSNGCGSSDENQGATTTSTTLDPTSPSYRFELQSSGEPDRHDLVVPVPVGRTAEATVGLRSQGETVEVQLVATVLRSAADGGSQEIELRIVGVDADDVETIDGLGPIVGAASVLRLDQRHAVVEQVLDVPDDLGFRADAVARQALRAPFALIGPLPLEPVGVGSRWRVRSIERGQTVSDRAVTLVDVRPDGYVLMFELPEGLVEINGRPGALLPSRQTITLEDAELIVTANQSG